MHMHTRKHGGVTPSVIIYNDNNVLILSLWERLATMFYHTEHPEPLQ